MLASPKIVIAKSIPQQHSELLIWDGLFKKEPHRFDWTGSVSASMNQWTVNVYLSSELGDINDPTNNKRMNIWEGHL